ncbi:MAG: hypothetical protein IJK26_09900 [Clostridia bacterium]|nr:hypothetical protein [Clostridia bacterium]
MRITKALQKQFEEKARELVARYNPYANKRDRSTLYFIDGKPMYLFLGKSLTQEQIDAEYYETCLKDIQAGYEQRMTGYYDKWYRYNHADEGTAYDAGCRMAADNPKCKNECTYIPCMH